MIIIDNGHGRDTPGKRSVDGRLLEWEWTRQAACLLHQRLHECDVESMLLVPEDKDIPIRERCRRANMLLLTHPRSLLVSIHVNAASDGSHWKNAQGWSVHVCPQAGKESRQFAAMLALAARNMGLKVRQPLPSQPYWEQRLGICSGTRCPAVLTENMFMDNQADCAWLLSPAGINTIVELHLKAILEYEINFI